MSMCSLLSWCKSRITSSLRAAQARTLSVLTLASSDSDLSFNRRPIKLRKPSPNAHDPSSSNMYWCNSSNDVISSGVIFPSISPTRASNSSCTSTAFLKTTGGSLCFFFSSLSRFSSCSNSSATSDGSLPPPPRSSPLPEITSTESDILTRRLCLPGELPSLLPLSGVSSSADIRGLLSRRFFLFFLRSRRANFSFNKFRRSSRARELRLASSMAEFSCSNSGDSCRFRRKFVMPSVRCSRKLAIVAPIGVVCMISGSWSISDGMPTPTRKLLTSLLKELQLCFSRWYSLPLKVLEPRPRM
uniref:Uncharacterized protein n=1 Tax=Cuerna arida TaxID=1464854 RepID=A0A1B6FAI0_9HEMI